jgi:hypothetical protein
LVTLAALMLLFVVVVRAWPGSTAVSSREVVAETNTAVAAPLGTPFTYQGELTENGAPVSGSYDFQFILYDASVGGSQIGMIVRVDDLAVADGLFTAELDFGNMFTGAALWLEIGVRAGSSTGTYSILQPRQPLTAAPYALGLRPGAVITGTLAEPALTLSNGGGDGLAVYDAGGAANHLTSNSASGFRVAGSAGTGLHIGYAAQDGIHIIESGLEGIDIENAARDGFEVDNAGQDGLQVGAAGINGVHVSNAGNHGLRVSNADVNGLHVDNAGQYGVAINNATDSGLHINSAGGDGIFVCATGAATTCTPSKFNNGLEIGNAENHGVRVDLTNFDGLYVGSAGSDGVDVRGGNLAGFFGGNIQITGSCTGCLLATFGLNTSDKALQPGDLVTIQGTRASGVDSVPMLMEVGQATAGQAIVGVVQGWAELVTEEEPRPSEIGLRLIPRDGAAQPGAYVTIIIYGPVQVQASALSATITPGLKLALDADGHARTLQTVEVNGVQLAENAPTIGLALSDPDEKGLVWVLLNPQ